VQFPLQRFLPDKSQFDLVSRWFNQTLRGAGPLASHQTQHFTPIAICTRLIRPPDVHHHSLLARLRMSHSLHFLTPASTVCQYQLSSSIILVIDLSTTRPPCSSDGKLNLRRRKAKIRTRMACLLHQDAYRVLSMSACTQATSFHAKACSTPGINRRSAMP
jgi:hypothetical protein